jgi:hypothetical protein
VEQWITEHFYHILGSVSAISTLIGGKLLGPRMKGWATNRYHVERDLLECQRRSTHREALLEDLIENIRLRSELQDYLESRILDDTIPPKMRSPKSSPKQPD